MPLCRILDENHRVYIDRYFPASRRKAPGFRYRVVLGVGGNIGDTRRRMNHLWVYLGRLPQICRIRSGVILRNPPFGFTEQQDFDNTVIEIGTSLEPKALLRLIWRIEKRFGRRRSFANAPRTLDLDILFFENRSVNTAELSIPHLHWKERISVTIPLGSLAHRNIRRKYENFDI
ncbi:MAG: 2-amino-4-hydroxy-6-hydroxymethyldihydropteridine diphosphokinase [Sulfuricurvum sp.]|uniref:2-amino-4-hydroxy-6- hydroxymethyldihydropteridine diphosphokinase n=1 Tax=Sulfuricurvum sp. TaxID=2025608 RepID=UPI0026133B72|nr:2-amino-4-hydroxy-6-hydroxymethyldihydropteridine diphosphokinase [Sulfuricurvum sp.]MDD2369586.1 2-amino-4-hydroxy-6-hydroxymethyldihydropteridine diphosphokinase [Sulfuricurvum sp.]MDD2949769.1 2-amino-4-hydroxy-6-hydroxymethyldihydropteridine diphosphokinase [Sulfuricurvum sp.]MDD5118991.1 2-amino-4-hydroxy-6-hydroxymethyldihydropteridine diphosphokinase [Sulfuricurvum sp.]